MADEQGNSSVSWWTDRLTRWWGQSFDFVWTVVDRSITCKIDSQAAVIAFNSVFAIAPLLTLASILVSFLPREFVDKNVKEALAPYLPEQVQPLLEAQLLTLLERPSRLIVFVTIVGFLWTISSATGSLSAALGEVGWRLHPEWLKRRLWSMLLGIVMAVGLALLAVSASLFPQVSEWLNRLHVMSEWSLFALLWVRWPLAGLIFSVASALFYRFGTLDRPRKRAVAFGGVISGTTAVLASYLLRVYFAYATYLGGMVGSAVTVFAGLLWLYALALGMLIGAVTAYVFEARIQGIEEQGASLGERGVTAEELQWRIEERNRQNELPPASQQTPPTL